MSITVRATSALARLALVTLVLVAGHFGQAQGVVATPTPLADGSEIVVTNRDGGRLVGYGRVEAGVLHLSFASHDDGLAVMVIDPDGRISTLVGRFAADGLRVREPGAVEDVTLQMWLSERGVTLTLDPTRRSSDDERDDESDVEDEHDQDDEREDSSDDDSDDDRDDESDDEADDISDDDSEDEVDAADDPDDDPDDD